MNVWKNFISVVKHLTILGKYVKTTDNIYTWRDVGENSWFSQWFVTILYYHLPLILRDLKFILCKSQDSIHTFLAEEEATSTSHSASKAVWIEARGRGGSTLQLNYCIHTCGVMSAWTKAVVNRKVGEEVPIRDVNRWNQQDLVTGWMWNLKESRMNPRFWLGWWIELSSKGVLALERMS